MSAWSRRAVLARLAAVPLALAPVRRRQGQAAAPTPAAATATPVGVALLPRDVILALRAVQSIMPGLTRETASDANATAVGDPIGSRAVTFATADGARRVVLSVDRYRNAADAATAFQDAVRASQAVPGVAATPVPDLGDGALIGIVTQGDETHVGGGARFGDLIVNATLQAFAGTDANKAIVAELLRRQADQARQALGEAASPTPMP
jgi:hypothetical protein